MNCKHTTTDAGAPVNLRNGMRVRLVREQQWCAGSPRVGSVGSVYDHANEHGVAWGCRFRIVWDRITARDGYYFGLAGSTLPDFLEVCDE